MPMEPIPGPGLEPQNPWGGDPGSDFTYTQPEIDDMVHPPRFGPDEPGIPAGSDPDLMTRFRDDHDYYGYEATFTSRSHSSSSSTGALFPLLILGIAIWFAFSSQSIRIPFFQPVQQEQQAQ